jgi:hypothetical protein
MKKNKFLYFMVTIVLLAFQIVAAQSDFNKLDDKGRKHAIWKGFHPESKRPKYEGTFLHGKETGIFYFFDDTNEK